MGLPKCAKSNFDPAGLLHWDRFLKSTTGPLGRRSSPSAATMVIIAIWPKPQSSGLRHMHIQIHHDPTLEMPSNCSWSLISPRRVGLGQQSDDSQDLVCRPAHHRQAQWADWRGFRGVCAILRHGSGAKSRNPNRSFLVYLTCCQIELHWWRSGYDGVRPIMTLHPTPVSL